MVTVSSFVPDLLSKLPTLLFMHRNATAVYMDFCHILIILAHREGPCVRAVELGLVGAMLGSQQSKAKAIKEMLVGLGLA
jgi:hypothetical protein